MSGWPAAKWLSSDSAANNDTKVPNLSVLLFSRQLQTFSTKLQMEL